MTIDVRNRILDTLRREETFLCAVATMDAGGTPAVRYVFAMIDDDLTIRFPTFIQTGKVAQIRENPSVALTCGETDRTNPGSYFQIRGRAEISTAPADRARVWTDRLAKWFSGAQDPDYAVVVVRPDAILALPIGGGAVAQAWSKNAAGGGS
jgi:general stress protein 26